MESNPTPVRISKAALITGWLLTLLPVLLLCFSAVMKIVHPPQLDEGFAHLQLPLSLAPGLGILELSCTFVYLMPRTSVLGAILLTGYLGGAILCHLRVGDPYWSQLVAGVMIWGGIYLRDPRLRALIPLRS